MTKILLIRPDIPKDAPLGKLLPYMPLGLAFLAAVLGKNGFEVAILDNYLLEKDQNYTEWQIQRIGLDVLFFASPLRFLLMVYLAVSFIAAFKCLQGDRWDDQDFLTDSLQRTGQPVSWGGKT